MKKIYLFILAIILTATLSKAQITITQNDMPHPGDSSRLTVAQLNPFLNYNATGANHSWDFSDLRTNTQRLDSAMAISATNLIYSLYFFNLPFNPNRSTVAYKGAGQSVNPLIPLTNPFGFYYLNSSQYKQTGFGTELLNFPTPIAFNNDDVIYQLPLQFGDSTVSNSDWSFGLNGIGYLGYAQTRVNRVDGWGSLITPHGTYNVLRVKTTRAQRDSIAIDSLNLNLALDRPLVTEYKWLANGETSPVLQVNTQTIFGLEIITEILFRDEYLRIETNPLASNAVCAGSTISVPYTKYGSFNGPGFFNPGNKFRAQLSDANGSFANPIVIGTVTSNTSGTISAIIPGTILPGSNYRIRVVSTDPVRIGSDNGTDIRIEYPATATVTAGGPLTFCQPGQADLLADSLEGYLFQWMMNGNAIPGATLASYTALQSGTYLVDVSNSCGNVLSNSFNITAVAQPAVVITSSLSQVLCPGSSVVINSTVTDALSMQWQLNGIDLSGEISDSITTIQPGTYTLLVTNTCGTVTSAAVSILAGNLPGVSVLANGNTSFCDGESVLLTGTGTDAVTFQWHLNGLPLANATDSFFLANTAGVYTLEAGNNCGTTNSNSITVTVHPVPQQPGITQGMDTLYATTAGSYQWFLNGSPLSGATGNYYVAVQNGIYTVLITDANGCTSLSDDFNLIGLSVQDHRSGNEIICYPNPATDYIRILLPAGFEKATAGLYDLTGRKLGSAVSSYENNFLLLNTAALSAGYYTVQVMNKGKLHHYPIMKN